MTGRVGFLTIGQSPRNDVMKDLMKILPADLEVIQAGALDDFNNIQEISQKLGPKDGELFYVTRMRDGLEVKVSKERLMPLMAAKVDYLDSLNVDVIVILCSGEFPNFRSDALIVYPDKILKGVASSISYQGTTAILIPSENQVDYAFGKWSKYFREIVVFPISPYSAQHADFENVGRMIQNNGIKFVVMDCAGYDFSHKNILHSVAPQAKVITTRGIIGRVVSEMFRQKLA
ncbi:MAG: AroM family protein [Candidatus Caldarchaeum sp.]